MGVTYLLQGSLAPISQEIRVKNVRLEDPSPKWFPRMKTSPLACLSVSEHGSWLPQRDPSLLGSGFGHHIL